MEFTVSDTERGPVFGVDQTRLHVPTGSDRLAPLVPALTDFIERAKQTAAVVRPELLSAQLVRPSGVLLSVANRAIATATANAQDVATATAKALEPPKSVAEAAARFGPEVRASVRNASPGDQAAAVQRASPVELAAMLESDGALSGLSPEALQMARDRAVREFHIARTGLAGIAPARVSMDRIIATGTDSDALDTQADAALERHKQRVAAVETDEAVLQHLVRFIAAALAISPSQALDKILASV